MAEENEIQPGHRSVGKIIFAVFLAFAAGAVALWMLHGTGSGPLTAPALPDSARGREYDSIEARGRQESAGRPDFFPPSADTVPAATKLPDAADLAVKSFAIRITGPREFENAVKAALRLIWEHDPDAFAFIRHYVYLIRISDKTGFSVENMVPTVSLMRDTALESSTWCAGAVAHQAFHAYMHYHKRNTAKERPAPPLPGMASEITVEANPVRIDYTDYGSILKLEKRADQFQLGVMRKIGATRSEIRLIKTRKPDDFSLNH
ncbi:MAG: hypothetical protein ABIG11_06345 [bacterium]